jgi:hypothetical protein
MGYQTVHWLERQINRIAAPSASGRSQSIRAALLQLANGPSQNQAAVQ